MPGVEHVLFLGERLIALLIKEFFRVVDDVIPLSRRWVELLIVVQQGDLRLAHFELAEEDLFVHKRLAFTRHGVWVLIIFAVSKVVVLYELI